MINHTEVFNDSYARVLNRDIENKLFFSIFYEKFTSASPEVMSKFSNTDMDKQHKMLKRSLFYMLNYFVNREETDYMKRIADVHCRHKKNIPPPLYDFWLNSLLAAVEDLDPKYDRDVELAWKTVMAPGIEYMKSKFDGTD